MKRNGKRLSVLLLALLLALCQIGAALAATSGPDGYTAPGCPSPNAQGRNNGNHQYVCSDYQEPTCASSGYAVFNCIYCGDTQRKTYAALGHDWDSWYTTSAATCTAPGSQVRYCRRCQAQQSQQIPALGHDWGSWQTEVSVTCTSGGTEARYCRRCQTREARATSALGHDWGPWQTELPANCTTGGTETRYCRRCQTKETRATAALGHKWGSWKEEYPGTCVKKGMRVRKCARCNLEEYLYGDYGDHVWGEWRVVKEPTLTEPGLEERVCQIESSHREQRQIPPTGDGPVTGLAALKVEITDRSTPLKSVYDLDDLIHFEETVTNTGDVDLELYDWTYIYCTGESYAGSAASRTLLKPGESTSMIGSTPLAVSMLLTEDLLAPGSETEDLAGIFWYIEQFPGYRPGTDEVLCVGEGYIEYKAAKPSEGPEEGVAALTVTLTDMTNPKKAMYDLNDTVEFITTVTNTGAVELELFNWRYDDSDGSLVFGDAGARTLLKPGESTSVIGSTSLHSTVDLTEERVILATDVEGLLGTVWFSEIYFGYRPGTDELLCWNGAYIEYDVAKGEEGPDHSLTLTVSWDEGIGEGRRYEGATIPLYFTFTNTGECPVRVDLSEGGPTELLPGEAFSFTLYWRVTSAEADEGVVHVSDCNTWIWYYAFPDGEDGWIEDFAESNPVIIPLTSPEPPEPDRPELTLTFLYDTPEKEVYDPEDAVWAWYFLENTGNMPLDVVAHFTSQGVDIDSSLWVFDPGDSDEDAWGWPHVGDGVTPGTETETLAGATTISYYYMGLDVETGEELCRTQTITRTWKVGKPGPWPIPSLSDLTAVHQVYPGHESSDPAGYQLGEEWLTQLTLANTGLTDIPAYGISIYDPFDDWAAARFSSVFASGDTYAHGWTPGVVTEEDVTRGYIYFPPVEFTWADPDSGEIMKAYSNTLVLPVISKTGLLLEKGYEAPPDGSGFKAGDEIKWTLTVTNTSNEPIMNVIVTDRGLIVGQFERLEPGEKAACEVPPYTVTEYDVLTVGYVSNVAEATGTDLQNVTHTYVSNTVYPPLSGTVPPPTHKDDDPDPEQPGVKVTKAISNAPVGDYYQEGETIQYIVMLTNNSGKALENIFIYDSLAGFAPISSVACLADGDSASFAYGYTVTQYDVNCGFVLNVAHAEYTVEGVTGEPAYSLPVKAITGKPPIPNKPDPVIPPVTGGKGQESCQLTLTALGDNGANYTLHACAAHTAAAQNAEAAGKVNNWGQVCEIWSAEIEALYDALYKNASSETKAAVISDRSAFNAYTEAFRALRGDEAAAQMLRLACAELCRVSKTAPERLPDSLLNSASHLMISASEQCGRTIGALKGSDADVTERYDAAHAAIFQEVKRLAQSARYGTAQANAFNQALNRWRSALDSVVNAQYKAADKETRKLIAAERKALDSLYEARKDLLGLLYENAPETAAEALSNLYRNALIEACGR